MSCRELARAATFLVRHGVGHDRAHAAGEFAYPVGLPGKSCVSGGLLAIVPGRCALCAWSPRLDEAGNSVAAVAALDAFTTLTGWSVF